jgi:hypothetical protein
LVGAAGTEEPELTSRLGEAIESELRHHPLEEGRMRVEVATQDIPSRGPGSLERKTGVDLYISIIREDTDETVSKGIIIQSKYLAGNGSSLAIGQHINHSIRHTFREPSFDTTAISSK